MSKKKYSKKQVKFVRDLVQSGESVTQATIKMCKEFGGFSDAVISFDPPTIFLDIDDKLLTKTK